MKKKFITQLFEFLFVEVGAISLMCLLFGIIVFILADWRDNPLEIILGLIAILHGVNRMRQISDKRDIIDEIKGGKNGRNKRRA